MRVLRCRSQFLILLLLSVGLSGCMVGPNFHSPRSPHLPRYTEKPMPHKTARTPNTGQAGKAQTFVHGENLPADWWRLFHSKELNQLITAGLNNSPNLAAAYAALRQAQEALNVQVGNLLLPAFDGGFTAQRQRFSDSSIGQTAGTSVFNLVNTSVNVVYTLDIFGGARRQIEQYRAQVDYQQFQLIAAYLTLTSNIVTTAVTAASLQEQIDTTRALLKAQTSQLNILEKQFELGGISRATVLTQQTLVNQTSATLPQLEKQLAQTRHALSVLVGQFPNCPLPTIQLKNVHLPVNLPVSFPSYLVRQRPDVRAAEALLHSASAAIGVATANLFPQFTINGNYGYESTSFGQLFIPGSKVWSMSTSITQPVFHGGALFAARRQAIAAYQQTGENYRQVVLQSFQNVADSLRAIETDARRLQRLKRAEVAARGNLNLTQAQFRLGGVDYLSLLNAQEQYQQTILAVIQAKEARYNDTVALFQSLGGGWWNKPWCVKECLNRS